MIWAVLSVIAIAVFYPHAARADWIASWGAPPTAPQLSAPR